MAGTKVSLGGNLPSAKVSNGLLDLADEIANNGTQKILAIVEFDVNYLKVDPRTKHGDPVLQIIHVEPLTGKDAADAERILNKSFTARTGEATRPIKEDPIPDTPLDGLGDDIDDGV